MELRYFNGTIFDFFISHNGKTTAAAWDLYHFLCAAYPGSSIFFDQITDENGNPRFTNSQDNYAYMREATAVSKIMIFIADAYEDIQEGHGNMPNEIRFFRDWQTHRASSVRPQCNQALLGVFLCDSVDFSDTAMPIDSNAHLFLWGKNGKIPEHTNELRARIDSVLAYNSRFVNGYAPIILDRVNGYHKEKADFFQVADYIIPTLKETATQNDYTPEQLYTIVPENNLVILGENGGIGKTSLLKCMFLHYLEPDSIVVPLWIEARALCENSHMFARYLEKELFDSNILLDKAESSVRMEHMIAAFKKKDAQKTFLFLIDGINEVPAKLYPKVTEHLQHMLQEYHACRFIVTSRSDREELNALFDKTLTIQHLQHDQIRQQLRKKGLVNYGTISPTLYEILSIPMYLMLYCAGSAGSITSKGQLIYSFFLDSKQKASDDQKVILDQLLPFIAYQMVRADTLQISNATLQQYITDFVSHINTHLDHYDDAFLDRVQQLYEDAASKMKLRLYTKEFLKYTDAGCKLFAKIGENEYGFTHQIYRDFLCSFYQGQHIQYYAQTGHPAVFEIFDRTHYEEDIRHFTGDLFLPEGKPFFDSANDCWDYRCNETSVLLKALYKTRNSTQENAPKLVANLIRLLAYVRTDDLTNLDLRELDFTETELKLLVFSRRHKDKWYATSFRNAKINEENLFCINNFSNLSTACLNQDALAILDGDGILLLWKRDMFSSHPIQQLEGLPSDIRKMHFSQDGKQIYAITSHELISIDCFGTGRYTTLYHTEKTLQNLYVEGNEVFFTTICNPFNRKPLSQPDVPDTVNFYYATAIATVNAQGTLLAFADNSELSRLRIYRKHGDIFLEQRWGYSLYLHEYILETEALLKQWGVYESFPTDDATQERRTFFTNKQLFFEDRSHDFDLCFREDVLPSILKELNKQQPAFLTPEKQAQLVSIADKYAHKVRQFQQEHPHGLKPTGRRVTGLSMDTDGKTLLLSTVLDPRKNDSTSLRNWMLLEFDPDTFDCNTITYTTLTPGTVVKAEYQNGEIVTVSPRSVAGYYKNHTDQLTQYHIIRHIRPKDRQIYGVVQPENSDVFYVLLQNYIFEISLADGRILTVVPCRIRYRKGNKNIAFCRRKDDPSALGFRVLQLDKDGTPCFIGLDGNVSFPAQEELEILPTVTSDKNVWILPWGEMFFRLNQGSLRVYRNGLLEDTKKLHYKLFISGCDFTGVTGNLPQSPEAMQTLWDYSAIVGSLPSVQTVQKEAVAPFLFPRQTEALLSDAPAKIPSFEGVQIECKVKDFPSENDKQKLLFAANLANHNFDALDIFILQWIAQLQYVNEPMLNQLVRAYFPQLPTEQVAPTISQRIKTLRDKLRFLDQYQLVCPNGYSLRLFTISHKRGHSFVTRNLGTFRKATPPNRNQADALQQIAFNQWFARFISKNKDTCTGYNLTVYLDSGVVANAYGNVDAVLTGKDTAYIVLTLRNNRTMDNIVSKIHRLHAIAKHYRFVEGNSPLAKTFCREPQIVVLCEDKNRSRQIHTALCESGADFTVLYTYDCLNTVDFIGFDGEEIYGVNFQ